MARIPFWQAPSLAFHSERPYRSAARHWRGLAIGYLLAVSTLVWLPSASSLQSDLTWIREAFVPAVVEDVPRIEIRGGQAHVMAETPVELTGPTGEVVAILDPDGEVGDLERMDGGLLLTRDRIWLETIDGVRSFDLSTVGDAVITREAIVAAADTTTRWLGWLAYPVGAVLMFLYRLVQALAYGLATLVLARTLGSGLTYAAAVRVTAVALTPVMVLGLLQEVTGIGIPAWWIVALATTFIYIYFGIRGVVDEGPEQPAGAS